MEIKASQQFFNPFGCQIHGEEDNFSVNVGYRLYCDGVENPLGVSPGHTSGGLLKQSRSRRRTWHIDCLVVVTVTVTVTVTVSAQSSEVTW